MGIGPNEIMQILTTEVTVAKKTAWKNNDDEMLSEKSKIKMILH